MGTKLGRPKQCFSHMPPGLCPLLNALGLTLSRCQLIFKWKFSRATLYNISRGKETRQEYVTRILTDLITYTSTHNYPEAETRLRDMLKEHDDAQNQITHTQQEITPTNSGS